MSISIGIIGAGVAGMVTAKVCLEASTPERPISVTVFEASEHIGGLWRFRGDVQRGSGSCIQSTIVNSSKEMTAFSDFPVPDNFPNFMHHRWMLKYLHSYASSFSFQRYILFRHKVESLRNSQTSDGYDVVVKDLATSSTKTFHFDAVAICTGHNHTGKMPTFAGQAEFKGQILHSHAFRDVEHFRGKRVVVVGVGNSSGDAAVELAGVAEQVYLSSRRGGTWLVRRTGPNGYPIDTIAQRRLFEALLRLLPFRLRNFLIEYYVQRDVGHKLIRLKPHSTRFQSMHVMVNDFLPTFINLGQVIMKPNISRFTARGVIFEGDLAEIAVDAVIFGTGYQLDFPFLPQSTVSWSSDGTIKLYKHVFDPSQPVPARLAFIGLTQPIGSLPPIAEMQARWFVSLLTGACPPLPSAKRMYAEIERRRVNIRRRYGPENETRFTFQADWLEYMDSVARSAGMKPNLLKYFFTDPNLWWGLLTEPAIPAQFRLDGPGAKRKLARKLILSIKERIRGPYKETKVEL